MCQFERSEILLGQASTRKLQESAVVVFGLGGVGGSLTEALARAGVGKFLLVDFDVVAPSNINRQAIALHSTVGRFKANCMRERISDINPHATVETKIMRINAENINEIDFALYDYIADAVDDVDAKIAIIKKAKAENKRVISCMGAGNRLTARFLVADIGKTYGCPLAKAVRNRLKDEGIEGVKAVFCPDPPEKNADLPAKMFKNATNTKKDATGEKTSKTIGSVPFIPPAAGLFMAGEIILELI